MPKLIENVLIGGRIRLAGEDVSEADARGIRPEVFEQASADADGQSTDPKEDVQTDADGKQDKLEEQAAAEVDPVDRDPNSDEEPASAKRTRGRAASKKA